MAQLESHGVASFPPESVRVPLDRGRVRGRAGSAARWKRVAALLLAAAASAGSMACAGRQRHEPAPEAVPEHSVGSTTVVPLQFAAAEPLAKLLQRVRPHARVLADQRTNALILVVENDADLELFKRLIEALDVDVSRGR